LGGIFTFLRTFNSAHSGNDEVVKELKKTFKPKFIETALVYRLREDEEQIEVEDY